MQPELCLPNDSSLPLVPVALQQRDKLRLVIPRKALILVFVFLRVFDDADGFSYLLTVRLCPWERRVRMSIAEE
jgi:hypothetical protein